MVGEERIGVKKGACGYEAEQRVAQEKATARPWREVIGALFKRIANHGCECCKKKKPQCSALGAAMLRLACALGALQTVADAFPAPLPLGPRVRRAEAWPAQFFPLGFHFIC